MAYKFRHKEVENMKWVIKSHCRCEEQFRGVYSASGYRIAMESIIANRNTTKRQKQTIERELALYHKLTLNDKPNW